MRSDLNSNSSLALHDAVVRFMTCNHQLRVLGNADDGRGGRETKQRQTAAHGEERKNWKDGQKPVILLHTQAITETQELSGGWDQREAGREGEPEEAQETKPLASVFTMHVKQTTMT